MAIEIILKETEKKTVDVLDIQKNTTFTGTLYNKTGDLSYVIFINTYDRLIGFKENGTYQTFFNSEKSSVHLGLERGQLTVRNFKPVDLKITLKNKD